MYLRNELLVIDHVHSIFDDENFSWPFWACTTSFRKTSLSSHCFRSALAFFRCHLSSGGRARMATGNNHYNTINTKPGYCGQSLSVLHYMYTLYTHLNHICRPPKTEKATTTTTRLISLQKNTSVRPSYGLIWRFWRDSPAALGGDSSRGKQLPSFPPFLSWSGSGERSADCPAAAGLGSGLREREGRGLKNVQRQVDRREGDRENTTVNN